MNRINHLLSISYSYSISSSLWTKPCPKPCSRGIMAAPRLLPLRPPTPRWPRACAKLIERYSNIRRSLAGGVAPSSFFTHDMTWHDVCVHMKEGRSIRAQRSDAAEWLPFVIAIGESNLSLLRSNWAWLHPYTGLQLFIRRCVPSFPLPMSSEADVTGAAPSASSEASVEAPSISDYANVISLGDSTPNGQATVIIKRSNTVLMAASSSER